MARTWLVGLALAVLTPRAAADATVPPAAGSTVIASLEYAACLDEPCGHAYSIAVHADGLVEYDGRVRVKVKGRRTARLSPAEMAALHDAFAQARFFELELRLISLEGPLTPLATLSYRRAGRARTVPHPVLLAPPSDRRLVELERRFEEIVHAERWVGSPEERRR